MERIKNIEGLKQLTPGEKFYVISEGNCRGYYFCGENPVAKDLVVTIDSGSFGSATCFSKSDVENERKVFLRGPYVSMEVGKVMVDQLNERIDSVEKIWMKPQE